MFSGIRYPVIRLAAETNKLLVKTGTAPVEMPKMPTLRIQKLWGGAMSDTEGMTLGCHHGAARVGRMSRRRLAGVIRRMPNIRRKARKTAFPPYLAHNAP